MLRRGEEHETSLAAPREAAAPPTVEPSETLYAKLSPGPGKAAKDVAAHQQARLHSAMVEIAGARGRGYAAVTVRELARLAGVSSCSFYEHFTGKEDCFLKTYELIVRRTAKRVIASQAGERDWEERLRLAFRAFSRELERQPYAARLALIEAHAAGPAAKEQTWRAEWIFAAMLSESFERAPGGTPVAPLACVGLAAGTAWVARSHVLWEDGGSSDLGDDLAEWSLCCRGELIEELARDADDPGSPVGVSGAPSSEGEGESRSATSDRDLILSATAKLAAEADAALTPARIRTAAGVSRKAFDSNFDGIQDCIVAAAEWRAGEAFARAARAKESARSWEEGVRLAMSALCEQVTRDAALARLCFVEVLGLGHTGMHCCERLMAEVGDLICHDAPTGKCPCPDDLAIEASVGAIWGVIGYLVVSDRRQQLPRAAATLSSLALAPSGQRLPVPGLG